MSDAAVNLLSRAARWLFVPAVLLVVWGELTPSPPAVIGGLWDKAEHFIAYFVLAGLATMGLGLCRRLLWAMIGILSLGGMLEILQRFTGRDPDVKDMLANILGVAIGLCLTAVFITLVEPIPDDYPGD